MAAPVFKRSRVEQTINLRDEFGVDLREFRSLRESIGNAIIERIRERSQNGEGLSFSGDRARKVRLKSPYSKEYADSLEFKAAGKSRGKVNMTLTGDMLGLMDVKRQTPNTITIGWNDPTENAKAFNHSTGDTVPRRPFFGISKGELNDIKKEFSDELKAAKVQEPDTSFEERVAALIDLIGTDGNG